jgi:hypothetical protein
VLSPLLLHQKQKKERGRTPPYFQYFGLVDPETDPGPAFYLNADPDTRIQGAKSMRIHADLDSWSDFKVRTTNLMQIHVDPDPQQGLFLGL